MSLDRLTLTLQQLDHLDIRKDSQLSPQQIRFAKHIVKEIIRWYNSVLNENKKDNIDHYINLVSTELKFSQEQKKYLIKFLYNKLDGKKNIINPQIEEPLKSFIKYQNENQGWSKLTDGVGLRPTKFLWLLLVKLTQAKISESQWQKLQNLSAYFEQHETSDDEFSLLHIDLEYKLLNLFKIENNKIKAVADVNKIVDTMREENEQLLTSNNELKNIIDVKVKLAKTSKEIAKIKTNDNPNLINKVLPIVNYILEYAYNKLNDENKKQFIELLESSDANVENKLKPFLNNTLIDTYKEVWNNLTKLSQDEYLEPLLSFIEQKSFNTDDVHFGLNALHVALYANVKDKQAHPLSAANTTLLIAIHLEQNELKRLNNEIENASNKHEKIIARRQLNAHKYYQDCLIQEQIKISGFIKQPQEGKTTKDFDKIISNTMTECNKHKKQCTTAGLAQGPSLNILEFINDLISYTGQYIINKFNKNNNVKPIDNHPYNELVTFRLAKNRSHKALQKTNTYLETRLKQARKHLLFSPKVQIEGKEKGEAVHHDMASNQPQRSNNTSK